MLLSIQELIGPFHPVLVHLPIGILLFAVVLEWLGRNERITSLRAATRIAYLLGCIAAIVACITGLSLGAGGEYDEATLNLHQWMGISVAIVSAIGYVFSQIQISVMVKISTAVVVVILVTVTGHLGGTLTHGDGYLTKSFNGDDNVSLPVKKIIPDIQQAAVYGDVVQPLLQEKCYTCHSSKKQKGGLRLDGKDWILKGGKEGEILATGKPDESELYKRLLLDPLEEHHMPPKGKPQLNEKQINLLHWWIANGNSFDKKVSEIEQPDKIKTLLLSLQSKPGDNEKAKPGFIPTQAVDKATISSLMALQKQSVIVLPVEANSNYLMANFVSIPKVDAKTISLLTPIQQQLIDLKLGAVNLTESSLKVIAGCRALRKLSIQHSNISDSGLQYLKGLEQLQFLNLVGTSVSADGLMQLKGLKQLESIYIGNTTINKKDWPKLTAAFPKVRLDSGGYRVPALETDTIILKAKSAK